MTASSKLAAFVTAQQSIYQQVLRELRAGQKQSHWIWFIFPQLKGLGSSPTSQKFGIESLAEARAYLEHPVLGPRLRECTQLMLAIPHGDISTVMPYPDDLKFRSSMTLFAAAAPDDPLFTAALQKYFHSQSDPLTLQLLEKHISQ